MGQSNQARRLPKTPRIVCTVILTALVSTLLWAAADAFLAKLPLE